MSTCRVRNCNEFPVTPIDLDPDKPGGPFSYPMEMPVCAEHSTVLQDPATEWACDNFTGAGPEVLIGTDLGDLNEWAITKAMSIGSGSMSRRQSKNLPNRKEYTLKVRKVGTESEGELKFVATNEEIDHLIESLTKYRR